MMSSVGTVLRLIMVMLALLVSIIAWAVFDNYTTYNRLNRNAELIENAAALSRHNTALLEEIIGMKKREAEDRAARHGAKK